MGLKFLYTIFTGLMIASFVGFGIEAFYPSPKRPDYPERCPGIEARPDESTLKTPADSSEECVQLTNDYNEANRIFEDLSDQHNRNTSLIALGISVLILASGLALARKIDVMADGLVLGGTLTLFYAIIRGLMTEQAGYRFAVISVGLIVTLLIGYLKFVRGKVEA